MTQIIPFNVTLPNCVTGIGIHCTYVFVTTNYLSLLNIADQILFASTKFVRDMKCKAKTLISVPTLSVEINSHADSRGKSDYNIKLSIKRATTISDYIVSKGVNSKRIIANGFGETFLINNCTDESTCSDDDHRVNRRTEFKLIKSK